MLSKCFGCITGCCSPSRCQKHRSDESLEIAGDDEEDVMSCRQPFPASSPPGWRHQGTLSNTFDSDSAISCISTVPLSQSVPPTSHKTITAAVSPFPGPAAYSTRSPAANQRPLSRETAVLPKGLKGGHDETIATSKPEIRRSTSTKPLRKCQFKTFLLYYQPTWAPPSS